MSNHKTLDCPTKFAFREESTSPLAIYTAGVSFPCRRESKVSYFSFDILI